MEIRQMEYVVALAEERHFTRAADLAGISQSGLSSAIRKLEAELGTSLFDRTTRRVEPTRPASHWSRTPERSSMRRPGPATPWSGSAAP